MNVYLIMFVVLLVVGAFLLATPTFYPPAHLRFRRETDQRRMSAHEKQTLRAAKKLFDQGKHIQAAQSLESIGMMREAINTLEQGGYIREAASVLLRMQRPHRAGAIYARHQYWREAAKCFRLAEYPAEVAKCAVQYGDFADAAEYFRKANHYEDAGKCYLKIKRFDQAIAMFGLVRGHDAIVRAYAEFVTLTNDLAQWKISDEHALLITQHLRDHGAPLELARLLAHQDNAASATIEMLGAGRIEVGREIFRVRGATLLVDLLTEVRYGSSSAPALAQLLVEEGFYESAGIVLERLESFVPAAEAFEKAGNYDRASYCYERSGNFPRARQLKGQTPGRVAPVSPEAQAGLKPLFSLSDADSTVVEHQENEPTEIIVPPKLTG